MFRASAVISPLKYFSSKKLISRTLGRKVPKKLLSQVSISYINVDARLCCSKIQVPKDILKSSNFIHVKSVYNVASVSYSIRGFHTSQKNNALPPVIWILLRPVANVLAIVFGRTIRKWWQKLPPKQKEIVLEKFRQKKVPIMVLLAAFAASIVHYYLSHLEQDPITKRWKFIAFTYEQMVQIAEVELKEQMSAFGGMILSPAHKEYTRVVNVANQILRSNLDVPGIKTKNWSVTVVAHPFEKNAFVLPDGKIFIFTGMLDVCDNDDQLGIILSHEMSHAILNHMAEQLSNVQLIGWLFLIPLLIFWTILPDSAALLSQWLSGQIASLMFHLPFSRAIETEADQVGLQLAAKACFDIREASVFWAKMALLNDNEEFEWLSTHPSHEKREQFLNSLMSDALKRRSSYSCPALPPTDPRTAVTAYRKSLHEANSHQHARIR